VNAMRQPWRRALAGKGSWSFAAPRSTVRGKLLRVVLLTTAIVLGATGFAMLAHELYTYRTTWAADLATEAKILAISTAPALAFDDHAVAQRNLEALEPRRRVMVAALYDADGKLYASYVRAGGSAPSPTVPPAGERARGETLELAQPVLRNGEVLGTIYLSSRFDLLGRVETYSGIFALVTIAGMMIAYILYQRLQRGITEPLEGIAVVARRIVSGRDYSLRATKTADDEIGVVIDAFNNMLEEVQSRSQALREADQRKDEFLATLAHELRNPLAPVRHAVKLLRSKKVDDRQRQWAEEVIERQVQRMALLLDDLLDVSRITRGRLDLKRETVSLESVVVAAVETVRPLIDSKQHVLTLDLPPGPIMLAVDPLRISQSLSNLLTNSAKYTDARGHITLTVRLFADELTLSVKDTGIGIDPEALPRLFAMFSQIDSAIARSDGGLGIGLALVKGLVMLHGGTVEARSAGSSRGSEFIIHLPKSVIIEGPGGCSAATSSDIDGGAASRLRVLVADDNVDAAESLGLLLKMSGHEVFIGENGQRALQIAAAQQPHALILDIGMPDMTGYEVARRIRAEKWGHGMLLIAATGWGQQEDKAKATAAGFDHHLTKPVDPDAVENLLTAFFQRADKHRSAS